jgi:hypothetical protein
MTKTVLDELAKSCIVSKRIQDRDVQILARDCLADGILRRDQAETLIAMEQAAEERSPDWRVFFLQTMADYLLYVERPTGKVVAAQADWLIACAGRDGKVEGLLRELLVTVVREADEADERLAPLAYGYNSAPKPRAAMSATIGWLDSAGIGA